MSQTQNNKQVVLDFYAALDAPGADTRAVLDQYCHSDYQFRGVYPFNEIAGTEAVADTVWSPIAQSFSPLQRRQDIFMAGDNEIDGSGWVISMGHLMGLFDHDWLGIPATGRMGFLRYADFNQVDNGKITQSGFFCDLLGVMDQAGIAPLGLATGAELIVPGPRTHDGLLFDAQDPGETTRTLDLVNRMKDDLVGLSGFMCPPELLQKTWHDDMIWYGPTGIGSTYTVWRYQEQHQGPFRDGLSDITFNGHVCRFAEGDFAGWFGWPNLTTRQGGGFLGLPANDTPADMRVVDMYRRQGDKLAENWVLIDLPYWLKQQGVDVLERTRKILRR